MAAGLPERRPVSQEPGTIFPRLGNWEKALDEHREALRLEPDNGSNYVNLGDDYTDLNRLDEAEAVCKQGQERKWRTSACSRAAIGWRS